MYDESLAQRIRELLVADEVDFTEKKMFGGVAFLLQGNMFVGITKYELLVRVPTDEYEQALTQPHVRPMDFTGKPMKGYLYVAPDGLNHNDQLRYWLQRGRVYATTEGPKSKKKKK